MKSTSVEEEEETDGGVAIPANTEGKNKKHNEKIISLGLIYTHSNCPT